MAFKAWFYKVTSCLREKEGEDANNDGGPAHDDEGEEVSHAVQVCYGWGQEGAKSGQGRASTWKIFLFLF